VDDEQQTLHMRKWSLYAQMWELWLPLLSLDKSASVWIMTQVHTCKTARGSNDLLTAFPWLNTPQGGSYWHHLDSLMKGYDDDV
jgi:hypothetical protein